MKLGLRSFDAEFYVDFKNALICREISSRSWDIEIFVQPDKFSINFRKLPPPEKWAENQTLNLHISVNFCPMKLGLRSFDAKFYVDFKNALICREITSRSWDIEIFVPPDKFSINNESEKKFFELTYQAMILVSSQIVHDGNSVA